MRPHRRQFLLSSTPIPSTDGWPTVALDGCGYLSHCPELPVQRAVDRNGQPWWIVGIAVSTNSPDTSLASDIANTPTVQVPDCFYNWAGRWIAIGNGHLYLDASGLLGCYFGTDASGRLWASSSPVAIARQLGGQPDRRALHYETGISWFPPPASGIEGITRLIPSQRLCLTTATVSHRSLLPSIDPTLHRATVLDRVHHRLTVALQQLQTLKQPIWLGLTAGYDSRLMLALCHQSNCPVQPFTRLTARMSVADRLIPPQLAKRCGYSHHLLNPRRPNPSQRLKLLASHSGQSVSRGDAVPFVSGARDGLQGLSVGGHGWAIASGFFTVRQLPDRIIDAAAIAQQLAWQFREPAQSSATQALHQWLEWVNQHPEPELDWRDRFFLEQRQAGWLSAKEQLYDLCDLVRVPILNCAQVYALLLGLPFEQRQGSQVQAALISRSHPELMSLPFNPSDGYFGLPAAIAAKARHWPRYLAGKAASQVTWMWRTVLLSNS